jgi:dGTPase
MFTREDLEKLEEKILAPYAMKSQDSAGRKFNEPQHPVRTCYQRDRDRVVHSEAFRKLEYKTQVFVIFEADYYRTRLTHTLEVAQIARTIGRTLRLNEDLIEAVALAHDLGHPPFGHAGEFALNDIMRSVDAKEGFNHNIRSFEIVTKFEKRYPEFSGLNLTSEVLIGILKHKTLFDKAGDLKEWSHDGPTLEAQVVDMADSLAYLSHDIDDGLTSGCINEDDLISSPLWEKVNRSVDLKVIKGNKEMLKYQLVKSLIDMQMRDLLTYTDQKLKKFSFKSSKDVRQYTLKHPNDSLISFSPAMKKERDGLQAMLNKKLYHHYRVVRMTDKAKRIIDDLFLVYNKNPKQLPYSIYSREKVYNQKERYRVICNYIASMTDRYALDEHKKLFDPYQKV